MFIERESFVVIIICYIDVYYKGSSIVLPLKVGGFPSPRFHLPQDEQILNIPSLLSFTIRYSLLGLA